MASKEIEWATEVFNYYLTSLFVLEVEVLTIYLAKSWYSPNLIEWTQGAPKNITAQYIIFHIRPHLLSALT